MPPKNTWRLADVALVGAGRRVDRRQDDIVTAGQERGGQRVVAQTAAAVHRAGAAGERENPHASAAAASAASADCWNERRA